MSESDEDIEWGSDDDDDELSAKLFRDGGATPSQLAGYLLLSPLREIPFMFRLTDAYAAQGKYQELSDLLDQGEREDSPEEEEDPDIKVDLSLNQSINFSFLLPTFVRFSLPVRSSVCSESQGHHSRIPSLLGKGPPACVSAAFIDFARRGTKTCEEVYFELN